MIIESQGRITITGSIMGTLTGRFSGHYSSSKHALEAFSDALALEMAQFDVQVSVIEPGNYNSAIDASAQQRMLEKNYAKDMSLYHEEFKQWIADPWTRDEFKDPDKVAEAVVHALFAEQPLPPLYGRTQ